MSTVNLTPTSHVVLGLIARKGPSTSYELKAAVANSIGNFWPFPHAQLYTEPARLAAAGYLNEEREEGGRRRRTYSITDLGRQALAEWIAAPTPTGYEVRDPGLLKLFFGDLAQAPGDLEALAAAQLEAHATRLEEYRELDRLLEGMGVHDHARTTLSFGLVYEEGAVRFWQQVQQEHRERGSR